MNCYCYIILFVSLMFSHQSKLVQVTLFTRHSERYPIRNYFNSIYNIKLVSGLKLSELTEKGLNQAIHKGKVFALNYLDFLKEVVGNFEINTKFYTSSKTRTIGTMLYRLKGMCSVWKDYTIDSLKGFIKRIEKYNYTSYRKLLKSSNIRMYDFKEDYIFFAYYNCIEAINKELYNTEEFQNLSKELNKIYLDHYHLIEPFGHADDNQIVEFFLYVADYLDRAQEVNIELTEDHKKLKIILNGIYFKTIKAISYSSHAIRIIGSGYFRELKDYINKARNGIKSKIFDISTSQKTEFNYEKLLMFSGHDMNFVVILSFLKVDITDLTFDFNAEIIFELYEDLNNLFDSQFFIIVKFEGKAIPLPFSNNNIHCDSQVFIDFIDKNTYKHDEVLSYCKGSKGDL